MYISIALLLVLSAFFSGSETAFFSLSKIHIKKLERSNSKSAKRILSLLSKTR
nr:CNNM domain-containing protein [Candidatus Cloacimonadota bacterium]